jgi:uncharacterized damage-inducible protein DinB
MEDPGISTLYRYLYWQRDQVLSAVTRSAPARFESPEPVVYRDLRSTLVHELDVERSWRLRVQGQPREIWDVTLEASAYPDVASLAEDWGREEADTLDWLADLTPEQLAAPVTANGLEGFPLATYLVHVVMHGVESISAAAILLHQTGTSVGEIGFLDFIDTTVAR